MAIRQLSVFLENKPNKTSQAVKAIAEADINIRAMSLAESLCGREAVLSALEKDGSITFSRYPRQADAAFSLRERVNEMIQAATES